MKVQETIRRETLRVAAGALIMTGVMLLVFALLGRLDWPVVLGALLGCCAAVLDFFLLGLTVQSAAELQATVPAPPAQEGEEGEEADEPAETQEQQAVTKQIRRKMQLSQMGRMLMLVVVALLGALLPCFDLFAVVLPFLFPKTVIYARSILAKK